MDAEMAIDKLQRIEALNLEIVAAESAYDELNEKTKEAKKRVELAIAAVFKVIRDQPKPMPLFEKPAKKPAKTTPGDDWRDSGLSKGVVTKLKKAKFATMSEFTAHPGPIGIAGLTESECEEIRRVIAKRSAKPPAALQVDDESWRAEPIESLLLPEKSIVAPLKAFGITTLGELAAWTEPDKSGRCKQLADIPGIGKGRAEKIEDANVAWWARRRERAGVAIEQKAASA